MKTLWNFEEFTGSPAWVVANFPLSFFFFSFSSVKTGKETTKLVLVTLLRSLVYSTASQTF